MINLSLMYPFGKINKKKMYKNSLKSDLICCWVKCKVKKKSDLKVDFQSEVPVNQISFRKVDLCPDKHQLNVSESKAQALRPS